MIREDFDPLAVAGEYAAAGAAALSVLTEPYFFGGAVQDIARVKSAVNLPVLRKDFIIDERQVAESRALGADAVNIGTSALIALGCHVCQQCHTGKCAWGICTSDLKLTKRVNPEIGAQRLINLLRGWSLEIKDILGGLGVNSIESLRGNRLHLRGVGLTDTELEILGVRPAGR